MVGGQVWARTRTGRQGLARLRDLTLTSLALQLKPVQDRGRLGDGLVGSKTFVQRAGLDVAWGGYAGWKRQRRPSLKEYTIFALDSSV